MRKSVLGVSDQVQPHKMSRGLKFRIWEEGLHYLPCIFVFAYAKRRFSHDEAHIVNLLVSKVFILRLRGAVWHSG